MKSEKENFESIVGGKHQKINSTFHSHRERGFKKSKILGSQRIEVENLRSQRLKKSKISRSRSYMTSKIETFEDG
jgi:hypothetical protein